MLEQVCSNAAVAPRGRRLRVLPRDPRAAFVDKVVGGVRPSWRAALQWRAARGRGDVEYPLLEALVQRGDTVVDVGANWGLFAYRLSRLVGPQGHVFAFEPSPAMDQPLRRLAGLANVSVANIGLSDSEGEARLHVPLVGGRRADYLARLGGSGASDEIEFAVQLKRLDEALGAARERVSFMKIDVEGHELAVLRGAHETLVAARPRLLLEIEQRHSEVDVADTFALLDEHGYRGYMLAGDALAPLDGFDVHRHQLDLLDEAGHAADGYVNQFAFVPAERPAVDLDVLVRAG